MDDATRNVRVWFLAAFAALLSAASACSFLLYMGQGIVVGALIGLPARDTDIALAQHSAAVWRIACAICLVGSIAAGSFALPFYANASRLPRLIARFILASIFSTVFAAIFGTVTISLVTAMHHASNRQLGVGVVSKVEAFRRANGRLPHSLSEVGVVESESCPCYCQTGDESYVVWYGTTPGESDTYDSRTKGWSEAAGLVCTTHGQ